MPTRIASRAFASMLLLALPARADDPPMIPSASPQTAVAPTAESGSTPAPAPPAYRACTDSDTEGPYRWSTGCSGVFGIRGSAVNTRGVRAVDGSGLMFAAQGEQFVGRGMFSGHGRHSLAIGGGGAGFEGTLLGGMTGGFRLPVGERHGPVLRAGALGYLRGNDAFYASLIDFPRIEVGYQYLYGRTVLELGGTTGAVLTGRFRAGESETRILGAGLEVGAYAALHVPWFRLDISAVRLPANDALGAPVRTAEGTLCAVAAPFAICADGRFTAADAIAFPGATPAEVTSLYGGLAFGWTAER